MRTKPQHGRMIFISAFFAAAAMGAGPPSSGGAGHAAAPSGGGGGGVHTSAAPVNTHAAQSNNSPAARSEATHSTAQTHQHHDRDQHYQTIYGSPWYPYTTGWNSGWYGNGYGDNGYYNDPSYGLTSNQNQQPATPDSTPVPPPDNSTSLAAQADNAINHSPEMVSANDAVQQAQAAFDADRERVIADLKQKPEYQNAVRQKHAVARELSDAKPAATGTPPPAVMDAASAKLDAADEVTRMQEQAIAADPKAAADKDRLTKLVSARDAMQAKAHGDQH